MQGKQIPIQSVSSSKNKTLNLPWWKWFIVINLSLGSWLITQGNDAKLGTQCWSLLLAGCAFSSGYSQVNLGKWQPMLMNLCITSIPAALAIFTSPLGNDSVAGTRGWLVSTEHVILSTWILKSFSAEVTIWWHRTQIFSWGLSIHFFPKFPCYQFSKHVPSTFLTIKPQITNWYTIAFLAISLSKQNEQPGVVLEVLHTGRISLHHCPLGTSQKGAGVLQQSTFGWCLPIGQNLCIRFLFPVNWSYATLHESIGGGCNKEGKECSKSGSQGLHSKIAAFWVTQ